MVTWKNAPDQSTPITAENLTAAFDETKDAGNLTTGTVDDARLPVTAQAATLSATYATGAQLVQSRPAAYVMGNGAVPIPVVMLHNLVSLGDAQGRLKDYKSWGYNTIFFSDLVYYLRTGDPTNLPEKPICITDDDGGLSAYQYLYQALDEFGMKATYFIVPAWVNGDESAPPNGGSFLEANPFTWANAVEMQTSGLVEFQSHTLTHGSMRCLTGAGTFTPGLTSDGTGAGADYLAAKAMIEANIPGANVTCSAVPYGVINEAAIESMRAAGCVGQRITGTGTDALGIYDGSGTLAYALPGVDPLLVPIADQGASNYLRRANKYGTADPDGNRIQNGKALVTSRGFTLPSGWTQPTGTLPQSIGTGFVFRGYGTAAANVMYTTDLIPVGLWGAFEVDWWLQATSVPASGVKMMVEGFTNITDTVAAYTTTNSSSTTAWTRKRLPNTGQPLVAFIKLSFWVADATDTSEVLIWDVRVRCPRDPN